MKFLIGLSFVLLSQQATASGCSGGDWQVTDQRNLPDSQILANFYGQAEMKVDVAYQAGYVDYSNVGTKDLRLTFQSGAFDLRKVDLVELLRALKAKYPEFSAHTTQTISTNGAYDDCEDIPEGAKKIVTEYSFVVVFSGGEEQKFVAYHVTIQNP